MGMASNLSATLERERAPLLDAEAGDSQLAPSGPCLSMRKRRPPIGALDPSTSSLAPRDHVDPSTVPCSDTSSGPAAKTATSSPDSSNLLHKKA